MIKFHQKGGALYIWGDNDPLFEHANAILPFLLESDVQLVGNTPAGKVLRLGDGNKAGCFGPHIITTGVISLYEGVTISYPKPLGCLQVLATSTDGHPVVCYADNEAMKDDKVGRIVVDCGYTKNYISWNEAGTARYIVNACVWLLGLEHKTLHNMPIHGKNATTTKVDKKSETTTTTTTTTTTDDVTPNSATNDDVTTAQRTTTTTTSDDDSTSDDDVTSSSVTTNDITSNSVTTNDVTSNSVTTNDVTSNSNSEKKNNRKSWWNSIWSKK